MKKKELKTKYYINTDTLEIKKIPLKKIYTSKKRKDIMKLIKEIAKNEEYYNSYQKQYNNTSN